jgi:hypothetical protein
VYVRIFIRMRVCMCMNIYICILFLKKNLNTYRELFLIVVDETGAYTHIIF